MAARLKEELTVARPTNLQQAIRAERAVDVRHVVVGLVAAFTVLVALRLAQTVIDAGHIGLDYSFYRGVALRFLETGALYMPHQLEGPYVAGLSGQAAVADNLYPPSALLLFVPFLWLPAAAWWVVPIAVSLYVLRAWRPTLLSVAVMLALLAWPRAIGAYLYGNTDMWMAAAVAAGLRWGWPAIAVTIKPTFLPLALIGARRRSWWLALGLGLAFVGATMPMWLEYVTAMRNVSIPATYSLGSLPLVAIPIVGWSFRSTGRSPVPGQP